MEDLEGFRDIQKKSYVSVKKEILEKMGIIDESTILKPNNYWCNTTQKHMKIFKTTTMEKILEMIFDEGEIQGIKSGKVQRSNEIMDLLNNRDLF